jgi:hypothetical protein
MATGRKALAQTRNQGSLTWQTTADNSGSGASRTNACDATGRDGAGDPLNVEAQACSTARHARTRRDEEAISLPNDIEFSGEKEGAQRLTPSPLQ